MYVFHQMTRFLSITAYCRNHYFSRWETAFSNSPVVINHCLLGGFFKPPLGIFQALSSFEGLDDLNAFIKRLAT